jgi:hypothetical protein
MTDTKSGGTGGCLCGAVRYRYEGAPVSIGLCQCRRCQRQSGSSFLVGVIFPKEAVTIEEGCPPLSSKQMGSGCGVTFCPVCGSAISITLDFASLGFSP